MSIQTSTVIGANIATTGTTQLFALGTRMSYTDGQSYLYVKATAATITQYYFVGVDEDFNAALLTTAMAQDGWMIGTTQVTVAASEYFWLCVGGANVSGAIEGSTKVDSTLYTSGVAGVLSETSTSGSKLDGVVNVVSATTEVSTVEVILISPRCTCF